MEIPADSIGFDAGVLLAHVSGGTKLNETLHDRVAPAAIEQCVKIIIEKTLSANGRVIKTIGDEVTSSFESADAAASAAIEMQSAINELLPLVSARSGVRIGLYYGSVVEREGDIFGDAVNLATRLSQLAVKGQIITARETVLLMSATLKSSTRRIAAIPSNGMAEAIEAYEVIWKEIVDGPGTTYNPVTGTFK